jgi:hypothetical protein
LAWHPRRDGFVLAADGRKPAEEWLLPLPAKPAAEAIAVVKAVRDARRRRWRVVASGKRCTGRGPASARCAPGRAVSFTGCSACSTETTLMDRHS